MNNLYKMAVKDNWTFSSSKGVLSVQQLWQLSLTSLDLIAISLNDQFKASKKKSFLSSEPDELVKLQLDLVLDIMATKQTDAKAIQNARADASHNAMIDQLIADKEHESMKNMSIAELQKLKK